MRGLEYKWLVGITFVLGLMMQLLDITILNVALATLGREFHADPGTLQWILTGYMLSLAVFIPSSGWIADRFGSRRTFQFAVLIFTLASVLCGLSTSIPMLIAARILQGVGGGMLVPVGQAMLFRAFPPEERAQASAVLAIPITVAPMLGPVIGGALVEFANWRWIFFINVPVGALALLFTVLFLKEDVRDRPGRFDLPGFLLAGSGLALLLFGLERGAQNGWAAPQTWGSLTVSVVLLSGLVWRELSTRHPILDLRLLHDRLFRTGNALLLCSTGAMFGVLFLIPLYVQGLRGAGALTAGLVLMPQAVAMLLVTQVISRIYGVIGPKRLIVTGFLVQLTVGVLALTVLRVHTPMVWVTGLLVVQGIGMGLLMTPMQTATFAQTTSAAMGHATSMFNVSRQVASALGTALVATVLVATTQAAMAGLDPTRPELLAQAQLDGYHGAFLVTIGFSVIGVLGAVTIRDSDAIATLSRAHRARAAARQGGDGHHGH